MLDKILLFLKTYYIYFFIITGLGALSLLILIIYFLSMARGGKITCNSAYTFENIPKERQLNHCVKIFMDHTVIDNFNEDYKLVCLAVTEKIYVVRNQFSEVVNIYYRFYCKEITIVSENESITYYVDYYTSVFDMDGVEENDNYLGYIFCNIMYDKNIKPTYKQLAAMKEIAAYNTEGEYPRFSSYKFAVNELKRAKHLYMK